MKRAMPLAPNPTLLLVTNVMTEQQLVERAGAHYLRFTVTDYLRPNDADMDRFLETVRQMPKDTWLHFHCHAGIGRATTFLALWDILHNCDELSLPEITKRQGQLLDGKSDLLNVNQKSPEWERVVTQERADFLRTFYEYAKTGPLGPNALKWSEWLKSRSK